MGGRFTLAVAGWATAWALAVSPCAWAHSIYLANDNHTDYGWNVTTDIYDLMMAEELDFYLEQIAATASNPPAEQARFNADCWWYLYNYETSRSPAQFQDLIDAMRSGHITVPLNPLVELYGALPTEAAIRAGYYPGRIQRRWGVPFLLAIDMENATIPWGLASIWAGSEVKYSWKGICECDHQAPYGDREEEVFRWLGPDHKGLLMKWYQVSGGSGSTWGGYAEARHNLSQEAIQDAIDRFTDRPPFLPITGLFGAGWDEVSYMVDTFVTLARQWNQAHPGGDQIIVSNEIDYFLELEQYLDRLPQLRGGWGNDWDLWTAALSAQTTKVRTAIERLRGAEALAALVHWNDPSLWELHQPGIETGLINAFKYFEHSWGLTGGVPLSSVVTNKKAWAQDITDKVTNLETEAAALLAGYFDTPDEDRLAVFNPLGFDRTDYADLPVPDAGPYVVTDVTTAAEVPSQVVARDGQHVLRILARDVPSLGYRVYRCEPGTPAPLDDAATISGATIDNGHYRVTLGTRGQIVSAIDLAADRELAAPALNDFGNGMGGVVDVENVGPVSATLLMNVPGPPARRVRITLFREIDRIEIENEIFANMTTDSYYDFGVNLPDPTIHFEEVGAIARPGLVADGGDFLPGTRADFMTLNHFVTFDGDTYNITLSNRDAFTMHIGDSTTAAFDLGSSRVRVLAVGNPSNSNISDQGGDDYFRNRFALRGNQGPFSAAEAMRTSLAHQNPLLPLALPRNQRGPFCAPSRGFLSVDAPNVVVTAFKPAEEPDRGLVVRLWELEGKATAVGLDAAAFSPCAAFEVSLIETDGAAASLADGVIETTIGANEIRAYRLVPKPPAEDSCASAASGGSGQATECVLCAAAADCVDADPCTTDVCSAVGLCEHEPIAGCPVCTADADCNDNNPCTDDHCDPGAACLHTNKTAPCDDGDACTRTDGCRAGLCVGADPVVCTALDQCHVVGECDPVTGVCFDPAKAEGTPCDDGDACTRADTCVAGSCVGADPVLCTALDQCHDAGMCDPATGRCSSPAKADGTPCNDGDDCTHTDGCRAGVCVGADPVVCAAVDQCHDAGVCDLATGQCSSPAKADGTPCDDCDLCTQTDRCVAGSCTGTDPVICTALDQCHAVGECDPETGVCSDPAKADGTPCNDGDDCTQDDDCAAGVCVGADPVLCTELDQCHAVGERDPATGVCSNPTAPDGRLCDRGDPGTVLNLCGQGVCSGAFAALLDNPCGDEEVLRKLHRFIAKKAKRAERFLKRAEKVAAKNKPSKVDKFLKQATRQLDLILKKTAKAVAPSKVRQQISEGCKVAIDALVQSRQNVISGLAL